MTRADKFQLKFYTDTHLKDSKSGNPSRQPQIRDDILPFLTLHNRKQEYTLHCDMRCALQRDPCTHIG